jgi:hypothetical protein
MLLLCVKAPTLPSDASPARPPQRPRARERLGGPLEPPESDPDQWRQSRDVWPERHPHVHDQLGSIGEDIGMVASDQLVHEQGTRIGVLSLFTQLPATREPLVEYPVVFRPGFGGISRTEVMVHPVRGDDGLSAGLVSAIGWYRRRFRRNSHEESTYSQVAARKLSLAYRVYERESTLDARHLTVFKHSF